MTEQAIVVVDEIQDAASMWLSRRDRGMTATECQEYLCWLRPSAPHRVAVIRLEHMWASLDAELIASLPVRCREVLTLRKIHGLSQKQIAARLGISESAVEAQMAAAIRQCTTFLGRYGLF